jgi:hypothetical protein
MNFEREKDAPAPIPSSAVKHYARIPPHSTQQFFSIHGAFLCRPNPTCIFYLSVVPLALGNSRRCSGKIFDVIQIAVVPV